MEGKFCFKKKSISVPLKDITGLIIRNQLDVKKNHLILNALMDFTNWTY